MACGRTVSGVLSSLSINGVPRKPSTRIATPPIIPNVTEVCSTFLAMYSSFAPIAFAATTLHPTDIPVNIPTVIAMRFELDPTAAAAVLSRKFPTKRKSTGISI